MKKNQQKENDSKPEENQILKGFVKLIFEVLKHYIHDWDLGRSAKKGDQIGERFDKVDNLLVKLDERVQYYNRQIEELKQRIAIGNILIVVLLIVLIVQLVVR